MSGYLDLIFEYLLSFVAVQKEKINKEKTKFCCFKCRQDVTVEGHFNPGPFNPRLFKNELFYLGLFNQEFLNPGVEKVHG